MHLFLFLVFCLTWTRGTSFDKSDFSFKKSNRIIHSLYHRVGVLEEKFEGISCNINRTFNYPENCKQVKENGNKRNGIYTIFPKASPIPFLAFCDLNTKGGGWTVILNRFEGSEKFNRKFKQYKNGFGALNKEFWLGLDYIHYLTAFEPNELLFVLEDFEYTKIYVQYDVFSIGNEQQSYILKVLGGFHTKGNVTDNFFYNIAQEFSTVDMNNNPFESSCTSFNRGGWWYRSCSHVTLTGYYYKRDQNVDSNYWGIIWDSFGGPKHSLKSVKMMVRPPRY